MGFSSPCRGSWGLLGIRVDPVIMSPKLRDGNPTWGQSRTMNERESLRNLYPCKGNRFRQGIEVSALPEVANRSPVSEVSSAAGHAVRGLRKWTGKEPRH